MTTRPRPGGVGSVKRAGEAVAAGRSSRGRRERLIDHLAGEPPPAPADRARAAGVEPGPPRSRCCCDPSNVCRSNSPTATQNHRHFRLPTGSSPARSVRTRDRRGSGRPNRSRGVISPPERSNCRVRRAM